MKETRLMMGMPITVEISDDTAPLHVSAKHDNHFDVANANNSHPHRVSGKRLADSVERRGGNPAFAPLPHDISAAIEAAFSYFNFVDQKFSTYKETSEITAFNKGLLAQKDFSPEMAEIFRLAEETKVTTKGFFNIKQPVGHTDPSGIVKGWAIWNAAKLLEKSGFKNFFVDAGGDIQVSGHNAVGKPWAVGIQNPFSKKAEIVKKVYLANNEGMATSGTYVRGQHIYNPFNPGPISDIVSLTVIGPNIYEADRFATAAFAMSQGDSAAGINFIENLGGFEGYMINKDGIATMTSGFEKYTVEPII